MKIAVLRHALVFLGGLTASLGFLSTAFGSGGTVDWCDRQVNCTSITPDPMNPNLVICWNPTDGGCKGACGSGCTPIPCPGDPTKTTCTCDNGNDDEMCRTCVSMSGGFSGSCSGRCPIQEEDCDFIGTVGGSGISCDCQ